MLHTETIEPRTLEILRNLQAEDDLADSYLVGGTSLALRKGYRKSVDIDLFIRNEFNSEELSLKLYKKYGFHETFRRGYTLKGNIDDIKIDIIRYDYDFVANPETLDGVRMLSIPDIIAMKLSVISDSGTRVKDFVDIAFLSTDYSLKEMLSFFMKKYPQTSEMRPFIGLTYFDDIDHTDPVNLIGFKYDWEHIQNRLIMMTTHHMKKFQEGPCPKNEIIRKKDTTEKENISQHVRHRRSPRK